jgi:putative endonuclease
VLAKDQLGINGEDLAARHLVGAGFTLVTRNWRCSAGEIDIVALDGPDLVIVEVKTRTSTTYGDPVEAVTFRKQRKLRELAVLWLQAYPHRGPVRFDVISVLFPKRGLPELEHWRGAF